jgi:NAD(P)H-flavin reductase
MLYVFGVGEAAISLSGDAQERGLLVHTIRAVGTVTDALVGLKRGATVGVRGPYGSAWPLAEAEGHDLVIVAGGIGLAPLRPVVRHALRHRDRYRRVALLVGARTPDDVLYPDELERWREGGLEVLLTVDRAPPSWGGEETLVPRDIGVVTALLPKVEYDPARTFSMICGPEVMMRFAVRELLGRGLPPARLFLSMERNMRCAVAQCGHCQYGPMFVCKDGPVLAYDRIAFLFGKREV